MEHDFNSKDLCRIIETASKCGVAVLKFCDVEITFSDLGPVVTPDLPKTSEHFPSYQASSEQKPLMIPFDQEALDEVRRSQLLVDDPVSFEQEMIDGFMGSRRTMDHGQDNEDRRAQSTL